MKKLLVYILITAISVISFVGCNNNNNSNANKDVKPNEEQTATTEGLTIENKDITLYSDDNITITTRGWKEDEILGTYLDVTVVNNSDKNISVTLEDVSIGDTMCYSCSSSHVKAQKKSIDKYIFSDEITEYTNLEATLHVFEYNEISADQYDLSELYSAPISYNP